MQNQLQYPNNFNPQQHPHSPQQQKFNSPTYLKSFDKTLPTMNIKHYVSNPNLSLEVNGMKTSAIMGEPHAHSAMHNKKNNEFRSPPPMQYPFPQNQGIQRPTRNSMTQSLIIGENVNVDVPEDNLNSKKELFKNIPKKQYRLSETIDDIPQGFFPLKKDELGVINSPKESNFMKKDNLE